MSSDIVQLYPPTGSQYALEGLYLSQNIRQCKGEDGVFIYSNFISSIDGRIALPDKHRKTHQVPPAIANPRDWRLFQELAAQADLLITSARYFRQAANSEAQDTLPLGSAFDDLRQWRIEQGLSEQPDIAIFSASLDIPAEALTPYNKRKLIIFTGEQSDSQCRSELQKNTCIEIILCGKQRGVDGDLLRSTFRQLGYRSVYAIAGPSVFHTLAAGNALDRLYLTTAHRLLGGTVFDTINWGAEIMPTFDFPLHSLYYDPKALDGTGQTLSIYGK